MGTTVATAMTVQAIATVRREMAARSRRPPASVETAPMSLVVGGLTVGSWNRCRGAGLRTLTARLAAPCRISSAMGCVLLEHRPVALARVASGLVLGDVVVRAERRFPLVVARRGRSQRG